MTDGCDVLCVDVPDRLCAAHGVEGMDVRADQSG